MDTIDPVKTIPKKEALKMAEEIKNESEEVNDGSASISYDCGSVCPVCSLIHNNCVLDDKHEEKHMCPNGHFWL